MMATDILAFYASHSPMTEPGRMSALIEELRPGELPADATRVGALRIDEFRAAGFQGFQVDGLRACERPGASRQRAAMVSSAPG